MDLLRSLPLGLYLEQPITWLHRLDARVKLAWLMSFLLAPVMATFEWRIGIVVALIVLTLTAQIPLRVWRQQMGWLLFFCAYVGCLIAFAPDGLRTTHQPRLPANEIAFQQQVDRLPDPPPDRPWYQFEFGKEEKIPEAKVAPDLPQPTDYRYILFQRGLMTVSQRSLDLALRFVSLWFTLLYSTTLYLLTTSPEEITAGLEELMEPLRRFKIPVTEIALTLTLSLRFIPLVLEEFQNLVRSVRTRAIDWRKLGWKGGFQVWMTVAQRLLENLLLRAEQIASAMKIRGFTSPDRHRVEWHELRFCRWDWVALGVLATLWVLRLALGTEVQL
ncbi:MAG: CbiQ family ECF transporter T component [Synechococcales bacterium]|nr:CbiQ family ECF transporter T component [Synechococcales bacterium]